jgi:hypothetical protein
VTVDRYLAERAWRRVSPQSTPHSVERIRGVNGRYPWKSSVFLLRGAGEAGSSVVAKRARRPGMRVERFVHADVLPSLALSSLRCHGFLDEPAGECCWLFLEEAAGEPYASGRPEHRTAAARWLGLLHTGTVGLPAEALPDRGPGHYLAALRGGRAAIERALASLAAGGDSRERLLERIVELFDAIEIGWDELDRFAADIPRCLVHGDFTAKNVRVGDGSRLQVFDWDIAGWGIPASDIADVDPGVYLMTVRATWPELDPPTVQRLQMLGMLYRHLIWIEATTAALAFAPADRAYRKLAAYEKGLREWCTTWSSSPTTPSSSPA